ncbi:uncharacterized protein H6S33_003370 [Morchella sextelata]|uniref:uncharacterized protein n=1 Tax=Morchella sextelata TaxID=1174677 RepID=UPI001D053BC1|nr:uncharacterized protein H6S33_003370 [Morchella sextelata]KAH0606536.1 hypothetical protein H6S33_003370 [Morchella sextelata]
MSIPRIPERAKLLDQSLPAGPAGGSAVAGNIEPFRFSEASTTPERCHLGTLWDTKVLLTIHPPKLGKKFRAPAGGVRRLHGAVNAVG